MQIDLTNQQLYANIDTLFDNNAAASYGFGYNKAPSWAENIVKSVFPFYYMTGPVAMFDGKTITARSVKIIAFTSTEFKEHLEKLQNHYGLIFPYHLAYSENFNEFVFRFGAL